MYGTMYIKNAQYTIDFNDKAPLHKQYLSPKMKGECLQVVKEPDVCVTPRALKPL